MPANLDGRVFDRQHRFANLPIELQRATKQFEDHAKLNKNSLFQDHHHALVKTVYSVKGKELIDAVIQWIETRDAAPTSHHAAATPNIAAGKPTGRDKVHAAAANVVGQTSAAAHGMTDRTKRDAPTSASHHGAYSTSHHGVDTTSHHGVGTTSHQAADPTLHHGVDTTSHHGAASTSDHPTAVSYPGIDPKSHRAADITRYDKANPTSHHATTSGAAYVAANKTTQHGPTSASQHSAAPTPDYAHGSATHHSADSTSHHALPFASNYAEHTTSNDGKDVTSHNESPSIIESVIEWIHPSDTSKTSHDAAAMPSSAAGAPTTRDKLARATANVADRTSIAGHNAADKMSSRAPTSATHSAADSMSHNESPSVIASAIERLKVPIDETETSHDATAMPNNTTGLSTGRDKLGAGHVASNIPSHHAPPATLHRTDDTTINEGDRIPSRNAANTTSDHKDGLMSHFASTTATHHASGRKTHDADKLTLNRATEPTPHPTLNVTPHNTPAASSRHTGGIISQDAQTAAPHHASDDKSHHAASTANYPPTFASHPAPTSASHNLSSTSQVYKHARQIAEALVLSGFLTPYHDDEKHMDANDPDRFVEDSELLVPVAPGVAESTATSVWSVAPIATYTAFLKRKAGMLGSLTSGKDVYVVMSDSTQRAYLFKSDLAHVPIGEIPGNSVSVQVDNSHFDYGVRVELLTEGANAYAAYAVDSNDLTKKLAKEKPELFNLGNAHAQKAFVRAWQRIGAEYRKASTTGANAGVAMPVSSTRATHAPIGAA